MLFTWQHLFQLSIAHLWQQLFDCAIDRDCACEDINILLDKQSVFTHASICMVGGLISHSSLHVISPPVSALHCTAIRADLCMYLLHHFCTAPKDYIHQYAV